jgi:hypothetical protein
MYLREIVKRLRQLLAEITSLRCEIVTGALAPQLSVAATCESSATGTAVAHEYVASLGNAVIVGTLVALTVMIWLLVDELPQASVAT